MHLLSVPSALRRFDIASRFAIAGLIAGGVALPFSGTPLAAQDLEPPPAPPPALVPTDTVGVVLDTVIVVGARLLEENAIIGTFRFTIGDRVTYRDLRDGQRRLWETGLFENVEVYVRGGIDGIPVALTLHVEERARVRQVIIEGLRSLSQAAVRDSLDVTPGAPYSPDRVLRVTRFIQDELATRGIPFARVSTREDPVQGEDGFVDLVLSVEEGARIAITDVRFAGNEVFTEAELRSALNTRREGFFWFRSGQFQESTLEEDLALRLPEFYASHGYLDFAVVYDTLLVDHDTGKGILEIHVEEGPQYRVASFTIEGNRHFPTSQLQSMYYAEEGGLLRTLGIVRRGERSDAFDQPAFIESAAQVNELYANQGYLYAMVEPVVNRLPPEDGDDDPRPRVDLIWDVHEGQPAYIRRIYITGNTFTYDRVIREQISLLPGQVYSQQDIIASYHRIMGLGFFETPGPTPRIDADEETGDVDITFEVIERQTGTINFGASMGGYMGTAGFLQYEQPNLFGQAKSGSVRWDFGRYQSSFMLSYSDPSLFQSRVSGTVSLFDSRDRFFSFSTGERKRRGFTTRAGIPIPGSLYARLFVGYSLSRTEYRLRGGMDDTSLFGRPPGTQSQVSVGVRRVTLSPPLFPTLGSEQSWTTEFNGGILGGDGGFIRHLVEANWWIPAGEVGGNEEGSRPVIFALGLKARAGAVFGDADRFPFDRFWVGGVQFGEMLRGYEETTVTPLGYFDRGSRNVSDIQRLGDAFMVLGVEYAMRLSDNISVSTFYEAGNVWRDVREMDPMRMYRGAGLALALVTPFGPLGIDYAYGFDKPIPGWQLHFRMGGGFGGF